MLGQYALRRSRGGSPQRFSVSGIDSDRLETPAHRLLEAVARQLEPVSGRQSRQRQITLCLNACLTDWPTHGKRNVTHIEWINPGLIGTKLTCAAPLITFNGVKAEALQVHLDVTHGH